MMKSRKIVFYSAIDKVSIFSFLFRINKKKKLFHSGFRPSKPQAEDQVPGEAEGGELDAQAGQSTMHTSVT